MNLASNQSDWSWEPEGTFFDDLYADDLEIFWEARRALLTHPLELYTYMRRAVDASFCRLLVFLMVGRIEAILRRMLEETGDENLARFFSRTLAPEDRVGHLQRTLQFAIPLATNDILGDFLATSYIRDAMLGFPLDERARAWITSRGFPEDPSDLTDEHARRLWPMHASFFMRLGPRPESTPPRKSGFATTTPNSVPYKTLRLADIRRLLWRAVEMYDEVIHSDLIQLAVELGGIADEHVGSEAEDVRREKLYQIIWQAARDNAPRLMRHRELGPEAITLWNLYTSGFLVPRGLTRDRIHAALAVFRSPDLFPEQLPLWGPLSEMPEEDAIALLRDGLAPQSTLTAEQILSALRMGAIAYELVPNIAPLTLFTVGLPFVDPAKARSYLDLASEIEPLVLLRVHWYQCVEYRQRLDETYWLFFRRFLESRLGLGKA